MTYCKINVNDGSPDTIQGGFALMKSISCALENAGVIFDGVQRNVTMAVNTTCFTAAQISDMGMSSITAAVTAAKPAPFNSNFAAGVEIVVSGFGTFKMAANASSSKIEFLTYEDQGTDKRGATYGSLDLVTGEVRYEARMERIDCTTSGSCGWTRHIKLYADTILSNGQPSDIESISFAYSNIQAPPGQSGYGGELVTASGNLSTGIKARLWTTSGISAKSDYTNLAKWSEVTNTSCFTSTSDAASTCGAGTAGFSSNTNFILYGGTYTPAATWYASYAGGTYTSVDVTND